MNERNIKNNAFDNNSEKLKPVIKTIFLDTDNSASVKVSAIGIAMLFFCVLAGTAGVVLCFADSFKLEVGFFTIIAQACAVLAVFTVIYFLPSKLFTAVSFLAAAGLFGLYIYTNYDDIFNALYYTLNLCLYKITQEGYIIGSIVDYGLAKNPNPDAAQFINTSLFLMTVVLACVFSYIVYSKKSMWISLLMSLVVIFPGFFYGLIPGYTPFAIIVAFWVAVFAINIFETGYIEDFISKGNRIPEKKLEKYKYKLFRKQYYKNVNALKAEIAEIVKSPNREENSLRLNKLVRELQKISNNQDWFLRFYGLNKLYKPARKSKAAENNGAAVAKGSKAVKEKKQEKEKFLSPLALEKLRIREEKFALRKEQIAEYEAHKKELKALPMGERFRTYMRENFNMKVGRSGKSGYAGFAAFAIALTAIIVAQPLVSPKAKLKASIPQAIMETLTSAVEYVLVGSNSSAYGGYSGGMGGGFLLNPSGANFEYKPVFRIKPTTPQSFGDNYIFPTQTFQSNVVYLKGWYGNIYDGKKWNEADKTHVDGYHELARNSFGEENYFSVFTAAMQEIFDVASDRANSEIKEDSIVVEHLGTRGTSAMLPYFGFTTSVSDSDFWLDKKADLHTTIERQFAALFKRPEYAVKFYSVDNILNRADFAVDDLKQYLEYYENYPGEQQALLLEKNKILTELYDIQVDILKKWGVYKEEYIQIVLEGDTQGVFTNIPKEEIESNENLKNANDEISNYDYEPFRVRINKINTGFINSTNSSSTSSFYAQESKYYDFVMENYLDIPETLPQEVVDLAEEITKDAGTNFDKALAIEEYLAENHEYTLHPMMPQDPNKDFVYNFLFETKEGYCTYYATSMVVMMRSLGIPARYVDGFLVDMRKKQKDAEGKQFVTVYDSNAHAWAEVYLRGIGWIPFEPTASIAEALTETEPYVYVPPARLPGYDGMYESTIATEEELEDDITLNLLPDNSRVYTTIAVIAVAALIIVILNAINYAVNSQRTKYFKTARAKDAIVKMMAYTLKLLKRCGFVMYNDEGLVDFAERVSSNLEIFTGVGFTRAAEIMQKARYSGGAMTEQDRLYVYDFVLAVKKSARKELKLDLKFKFKYVYFIL